MNPAEEPLQDTPTEPYKVIFPPTLSFTQPPKPQTRQYTCTHNFDAPYQGNTTWYKKDQTITDPNELDYLLSIKAPLKEVK